MKFEGKIVILSVLLSFVFMIIFTYFGSLTQKTIYAYQVGIYKEKENMNNKLNELKDNGIEGMYYQKEGQYYVISMMTSNKEEINEHANKVKGIVKKYIVSSDMSYQALLTDLSKGVQYD